MDKSYKKVTRKRKSEILDDVFDEIIAKKSKSPKKIPSTTSTMKKTPSAKANVPSKKPGKGKSPSTNRAKEKVKKGTNEQKIKNDGPTKTTEGDKRHSFEMWTEADKLCQVEKVSPSLANNFISLLNNGCTLPFIARYRKTAVEYLLPDRLQELHESYLNVAQLKKKVNSVIESLRKSDKLTPEIQKSLLSASNLFEVDLVYAPLKNHSLSLAERARNLGLEPLVRRALSGSYNIDLQSICTSEEELNTVEKVATHMTHIAADIIYKDTRVIEKMRKLKVITQFTVQSSRTTSSKTTTKDEIKKTGSRSDPDTYKLYFNWKCLTRLVKPYQTLAINRGEDEKILTVKIIIPDFFYIHLESYCLTLWGSEHWVRIGLADAYRRLIKPWLSRQVRGDMTKYAEKGAVKTFISNLERYLLTQPIKNRIIAGLDPGFKAGCKVGIININGDVLAVTTIYPNLKHCKRANKDDIAVKQLQNLLTEWRVQLIGLGNGTACRETETWLKSNGISNEIPVVIVPEQGASIYSVSKEARKEHPHLCPTLISALSIARRVLDPLGELIKVEPKNLGIGLYQHDIPPKMLDTAVEGAVEKVVSLVGADVNTASQVMLKRISGLNDGRAKKIINYRQEHTRFNSRAELMKVVGIGKITFQQCAGFLKVLGGTEILDTTIIHPESYDIARKFAEKIDVNINHLAQPHFPEQVELKTASINLKKMSKELGTDVATLELIINVFKQKPQEDNIISFSKPVYSANVQAIEQIKEGMVLTGVVRNVVPFGCFVDCGVKDNGLIHRSQLRGQSPKLGDRVSVTVLGQPMPRKIQLKLNKILN